MTDAAMLADAMERPEVRVPAECRPRWQHFLWFHRVLGPKVYKGRILSHAQFEPFLDRLADMEEEGMDPADLEALLSDYLKAIKIPKRAVLRLPSSLQQEVAVGFFACQAAATPPSQTTQKRMEKLAASAPRTRHREATLQGT